MDQLDAMIMAVVAQRNAKRAEEGKPPLTEEDVAELKQQVQDKLNSEDLHRMADAIRAGGGEQMHRIALLNGMSGGMALMHAIIGNCPSLTTKRRAHYMKKIKYPGGVRPDAQGRTGGLKIEVSTKDGMRNFMLHTASVSENHDFGQELAKLEPLLDDEKLQKVKDQCAHLMNFARQAYSTILANNQNIIDALIPKLERLQNFSPMAIHVDDNNTTFYLQSGGPPQQPTKEDDGPPPPLKKWEPRCGIRLTEITGEDVLTLGDLEKDAASSEGEPSAAKAPPSEETASSTEEA